MNKISCARMANRAGSYLDTRHTLPADERVWRFVTHLFGVRELRSERVVQIFHQVGAGEERDEIARAVHDGKFALFRFSQYVVGFRERNARACSDEVACHDRRNGGGKVRVELDIASGDDADELGADFAALCNMRWSISSS